MLFQLSNSSPITEAIASQATLEGNVRGDDGVVAIPNLTPQTIPLLTLETCGFEIDKHHRATPPDILLTRWFDYTHDNPWHRQTMACFPLNYLMNNDLGSQCPTGTVTRYIDPNKLNMSHLFHNDVLVNYLRELKTNNLVRFSFLINTTGSVLIEIGTGCISWEMLCMLEGNPGNVLEFFVNPLATNLMPSWVAAILVTRPLWPYNTTGDREQITGITHDVAQHFWIPYGVYHRKSLHTTHTIIGIATAWSHQLANACSRALHTCQRVGIAYKQYRTDILTHTQELRYRLNKGAKTF